FRLWASDRDKDQTQMIRADLKSADFSITEKQIYYLNSQSQLTVLTRTPSRPAPGFNSILLPYEEPNFYRNLTIAEAGHFSYFTIFYDDKPAELWRTDWTNQGTVRIFVHQPNLTGSDSFYIRAVLKARCFFQENDKLIVSDPISGFEIFENLR